MKLDHTNPRYAFAVLGGTLGAVVMGIALGIASGAFLIYAAVAVVTFVMRPILSDDVDLAVWVGKLAAGIWWAIGSLWVAVPVGMGGLTLTFHNTDPSFGGTLLLVVASFYASNGIYAYFLRLDRGGYKSPLLRGAAPASRLPWIDTGHAYLVLGLAIAASAWVGGPVADYAVSNFALPRMGQWPTDAVLGGGIGAAMGFDVGARLKHAHKARQEQADLKRRLRQREKSWEESEARFRERRKVRRGRR